jgi:16S rRNA (cytidine1402-2'-O)-methyltransferase
VAQLAAELARRGAVKGEMTLIVAGKSESSKSDAPQQDLVQRIRELMRDDSLDEKAVLKQVAKDFGISKSDAYREWQRQKK